MRLTKEGQCPAKSGAAQLARTMPFTAALQPAVLRQFPVPACTHNDHFAPKTGGLPACLFAIGAGKSKPDSRLLCNAASYTAQQERSGVT
jgi:hypothetical protein